MASKPSRRSIGAVRNSEAHRSILAAAAEILNESGYAGFTIEAVARRAGASKPTIYRWWTGKAALIMEVYELDRKEALSVSDRGSLERELIFACATSGACGKRRHWDPRYEASSPKHRSTPAR